MEPVSGQSSGLAHVPGLAQALSRLSRQEVLPDGRQRPCLPLAVAEELALSLRLPLAQVEIAALEQGIAPERYLRNFDTYTLAEQARLLASRVALVGLGGLGGYVLELLARAGVGGVTAADGDEFAPSNLNRQLYCTSRSLGGFKAAAAAARVERVNPAVVFTPVAAFLDEANMARLLGGAQLCIDALGGLTDRPALARAAGAAGIPLLTAAVAGQSGYVATVLPGQPSPADFFGPDASAPAENTLGTPGPAVCAASAILAGEALNILCGRAPALAGSMLLFDLSRMSFETVRL